MRRAFGTEDCRDLGLLTLKKRKKIGKSRETTSGASDGWTEATRPEDVSEIRTEVPC